MIDVSLPPSAKDYDGYLLVKFTSKLEYQKDFLNGKLYFSASDFFALGDTIGVSDHTESQSMLVRPNVEHLVSGQIEIIDGIGSVVLRDYTDIPDQYPGLRVIDYSFAENRKRKVISLYSMFICSEKNEISTFSERMQKEFGEYAVLILNRHEFFKRVVNAFKKDCQIRDARFGFVSYKSKDEMSGLVDWNPFFKPTDFDYQNEFRISFVNDLRDDLKLDLGRDLKDIAVSMKANDLFSKMRLSNGNLYFD